MVKRVGSLSAALSKYKGMNASVRVGVLENATYPDGTPVAMVAFWNEYGTRLAPPRPFFRNAISENKGNWVKSIKNLVAIHNDPKKAMGLMGEHIKGQIVQSIQSLSSPENSDVTKLLKNRFPMGNYRYGDYLKAIGDVAKGKTESGGNNNPLIWTGQMMRSISFEVGEGE